MLNSMIFKSRSLWRIGLIGIAICAGPSCLLSQEVSRSESSNTTQPFAGFDDSLTKAADTLLIFANQAAPPTTIKTIDSAALTTGLSWRDDQRASRSGGRAKSAAAARLNLLRPAVEPILRNRGVPTELAAVILVESGGRVDALSPKGARGLWQLMPDTARRYGLHVDEIRDDRLDLFKGTDAAARYLHDLYVQFGDWRLALAAYNTGEAKVGSAILKGNSQDFYRLSHQNMLPLETRNYVPRVLGVIRSFGQPSVITEFRDEGGAKAVFASSSR